MSRGARIEMMLVTASLALGAWPASVSGQVVAARMKVAPAATEVVTSRMEPRHPLPALLVKNLNTRAEALVRLYDDAGALDGAGVDAFCKAAGEGDEAAPLKARVIQIVFKAAYELGAKEVLLVSSFRAKDRRGRGGYHTTGEAIDFQLPGVPARKLASYLRGLARVGVGIYTHPKTQYVHVDVREQSYHWLDASPPGRTWREARLRDPNQEQRDAAYRPEDDLPKT